MRGMQLLTVSFRMSLVCMVLCGLLYNLAVTGIAQGIMPGRASGSLVTDPSGTVVGSALIGQAVTDPAYFQSRISSIAYKADGSGTPNYAPSNPELLKRVAQSIQDWQANNPDVPVALLPIDLVTNSGSGLDPHISPAAAMAQIPRISKLTGLPQERLKTLVQEHTEQREFGFLGEPAVNVLKLNLALQALSKKP